MRKDAIYARQSVDKKDSVSIETQIEKNVLFGIILLRMRFNSGGSMFKITEEINDILDLGYSLSTEQFYLRLFDLVMEGCMKFTGADAGDLFIENNGE